MSLLAHVRLLSREIKGLHKYAQHLSGLPIHRVVIASEHESRGTASFHLYHILHHRLEHINTCKKELVTHIKTLQSQWLRSFQKNFIISGVYV